MGYDAPLPFVPGFWVPACAGMTGECAGMTGECRGNDVGGLSEPRIALDFTQMPLPSRLAPVVLSEPGMGVVTIS